MSFVFAPPQQAVVPVQDETYSYFPIRRVFGIARNYAEPGAATKDTPFYFMKDCYTVVPVADGECARIPMPPQSQVLKHEIELVACLGKGGRNLTLEQASRRLQKIRQMPNHPAWEQILASALGSGAFCAIFGGSLLDCAISTLCGIILWIYVLWVSAPYLSKVIGNITGGMLVSLMCIISHHLIPSAHLGNMVIGAIIPLIPGISFTNGIRDLAAEDYLAGMTRLADALMVFFCMAIGVCTIFIIDSYIFGSMIQLHGMLTDPLTANWLIQIEVAYLGTVSFAVLFGVPRRFYHGAGICGTLGWIVYLVFTRLLGTSGIEAMFFATMIVVLSSYQCASTLHCPVIIFIVCGIFPLVPGAGVFWTSYYIVSDQLQAALNSGFMACKGTVAIVFGIIIMTEFSRRFKLFNVWNSFVKLLIKPLNPRY